MAKATSCSQRYVFCLPSKCASSPPNLQHHSVQHNLLSRPCPTLVTHPVKRPVSPEVFLLYQSSPDLVHHSQSQTCIAHLTSTKSILDPWHIPLLVLMTLFMYLLHQPCSHHCLCFPPLVYFIDLVLFLSPPCSISISKCLLVTVYTPSCLIPYKYPSTSPRISSLKPNKSLLPILCPCPSCPTGTYAMGQPLSLYPIGLSCSHSYSQPRSTSALPSSFPWSGICLDFDAEKTWT